MYDRNDFLHLKTLNSHDLKQEFENAQRLYEESQSIFKQLEADNEKTIYIPTTRKGKRKPIVKATIKVTVQTMPIEILFKNLNNIANYMSAAYDLIYLKYGGI